NIVAKQFSTRLHPTMLAVQQESAQLSSVVEETVTGIRVVKGFAAENRQSQRLGTEASDVYDASMDGAEVRSRYVLALEPLPHVGLILVLVYGGHKVISGDLALGQLVAFNAYVVLLVGPLRMLGWMVAAAQRAVAAASRVHEVLSVDPEIFNPDSPAPLPAGRGHLQFDDVTFGYSPESPIL